MLIEDYYNLMESLKDKQFTYFVGGRQCGKIHFYATYLQVALEHMLGGKTQYELTNQLLITINNDDIGEYKFITLINAIYIEGMEVRLQRMLEEYDGYMRYKYRDYKESEVIKE